MTKVQLYRDDDKVISFDSAAFLKAITQTAADVAGGSITPTEARRIAAEYRAVLRAVEGAIKLGRGR
jgi:hypothetical protein